MAKNGAVWVALACVSVVAGSSPALAGHGVVYTPSFYPQEIAIETIDPASAAAQLQDKTLHAYIGSDPGFGTVVPDEIRSVESIRALLVVTVSASSAKLAQPEDRCAAVSGILAVVAGHPNDMVLHPYPITPFHPDYLQHLDRIERAKANVRAGATLDPDLRIRATSERVRALLPSLWRPGHEDWDLSVEEVPIDRLKSPRLQGWPDPPWIKQGWFQAYNLLASGIANPEYKRSVEEIYRRLTYGKYENSIERLNLERLLIANLTRGCERAVLGYTLRREYYNDAYDGVEGIANDSQLGLNAPVVIRTVKLKDFPWNGWLRLGIDEKPQAAWNPIAGFSDGAGALVWASLADPVQISTPYGGSWIPNRVDPEVTLARGLADGIALPADAVLPRAGSGALQPVGDRKSSLAKVVYRVRASRFHDGTHTEVADLLYPYALAFRWGVKTGDGDGAYDPAIDAATARLREQLVGLKVLGVDQNVVEIARDIRVRIHTPIIELYVDCAVEDPLQVAQLAPPWSQVPWHVSALMEEAVQRGWAAFSESEAQRLAVSWLDLARDGMLHQRLRRLVEENSENAYRPLALREVVTAEEARRRWQALEAFAEKYHHFLVTNGPYRLKAWSDASTIVEVDRELTYPHGVGSFNHYAHPAHAVITDVVQDANEIRVAADAEMLVQEQRIYRSVRKRLRRNATRGLYLIRTDSRYLLVGPDGTVVQVGALGWEDDQHLAAKLPQRLPPGRYTFLLAIYLDGNSVNPSTKILSFEAPA